MGLTKSRNIFFVSALSFALAAAIQLTLDFATPIPIAVLEQYRPSWLANAAGGLLFVLTLAGFGALVWGLLVAFQQGLKRG